MINRGWYLLYLNHCYTMDKPQLITILSSKYSEEELQKYSEFELQLMYCAMTAMNTKEARDCVYKMEQYKSKKA